MKKKFLTGLAVFIIIAGIVSFWAYENRKELVFCENLDLTAATVDGDVLTMRDMAFYVAYQEAAVEEQARVYSLEDTGEYWKLQSGATSIKLTVKENVWQQMIHDYIFYQMALEHDVSLDEDEIALLDARESDFWSDLTEYQRQQLGVKEADIYETMYRMALGQKYQSIYAIEQNMEYDAYETGGELYQKLLSEHKYKINEHDWNRMPFGDITLIHKNHYQMD